MTDKQLREKVMVFRTRIMTIAAILGMGVLSAAFFTIYLMDTHSKLLEQFSLGSVLFIISIVGVLGAAGALVVFSLIGRIFTRK